MKIRINAISSEGIDAYRILRLMEDGSHVPIPGIDWQGSAIFEGMHNGGGYVLQVRDVTGGIAEHVVPIEQPLQVISYGAYILDGAIYVTAATNIPARVRIRWDISVPGEEYESPPLEELNDLGWSDNLGMGHTVALPYYYMGAVHHYWITVRSQLNQRKNVNGRYIITPEALDPIRRGPYTKQHISKVGIENEAVSEVEGLDYIYNGLVLSDTTAREEFDLGIGISKNQIAKNTSIEHTSLEVNYTYTIE